MIFARLRGVALRALVFALAWIVLVVSPFAIANAQEDRSPESQDVGSTTLDELRLGLGAMDRGEFDAALEHFRNARDRAGNSEARFQAVFGAANALSELGRLDEAVVMFEEALTLRPEDAEVLFSLGSLLGQLGLWEEASARFAEAAVRDPEMVAAFVELGIAYEHRELHAESESACSRAVSSDPDNVRALLCLAVGRYHLGAYEGASLAFSVVTEIEPGNAQAHYGLGLSRLYLGDRAGAMAEQRALRELDEDLARDLADRVFADAEE